MRRSSWLPPSMTALRGYVSTYAMWVAALIATLRRDLVATRERCEAGIAAAAAGGGTVLAPFMSAHLGWAMAIDGDAAGIERLVDAVAAVPASGTGSWRHVLSALVADAYVSQGRFVDALSYADDGLAQLASRSTLVRGGAAPASRRGPRRARCCRSGRRRGAPSGGRHCTGSRLARAATAAPRTSCRASSPRDGPRLRVSVRPLAPCARHGAGGRVMPVAALRYRVSRPAAMAKQTRPAGPNGGAWKTTIAELASRIDAASGAPTLR